MISLMWKVKKVCADELGCDGCTMLEPWATSTVQRPPKCKLDEKFVYCPVTGKMPADWEKCARELNYVFVDEEA